MRVTPIFAMIVVALLSSQVYGQGEWTPEEIRGHVLHYRADTGYAGNDAFEVLSIGPSGHATHYVITVKIIGDAKTKAGR